MNMKKEPFTGIWKLISSEYRLPDGQATYPMGRDATGLLVYSADGRMCVQIMNPNRPDFASGDRMAGTAEEIKSAFEGYVAYFGTYDVDDIKGVVTHHIEGSSFPNWAGKDQKRFFELSGGRLTLRTPPIRLGGRLITGVLHWERIE